MAFGKDGAETMETNLSRQAYNLFLSLAAGGGLGLLYDLLFTPEYGEKKHAYVREGLFLALSFAWLLVLVLFLEGEFGAAFFFGAMAGVCVYYSLMHKVSSCMIRHICRFSFKRRESIDLFEQGNGKT